MRVQVDEEEQNPRKERSGLYECPIVGCDNEGVLVKVKVPDRNISYESIYTPQRHLI